MNAIRFPVIAVTLLWLFYQLTPFLGIHHAVIIALFCIMPFALVWMVIRILKDGVPSGKTFDEQWYDD